MELQDFRIQLELNPRSLFIITQNALPSKWESIEGHRLGVVSCHYGESFSLIGEFEGFGDGVVKSNGLVECHVCPSIMMSLVNTPA